MAAGTGFLSSIFIISLTDNSLSHVIMVGLCVIGMTHVSHMCNCISVCATVITAFICFTLDNGTKAAESRKQTNSRTKPAPSNSNKPAKVSTGEATPNNPQLLSPGKTSNNSSKQLNNAAPQQNSTGTQASVPNKDKVRDHCY